MKRPRIYICGSYTAKSQTGIERNVRNARVVGRMLNALGYTYSIVPHQLSRGMEDSLTPSEWYDITMGEMLTCDAVYVMAGFRESVGCQNEIAEAVRRNMPIIYAHEGDARIELFLRELRQLHDKARRGITSPDRAHIEHLGLASPIRP